jgi:alpha-L-rhamnosidase
MFGKEPDYEQYSSLADKIKKAFNEKYLNRETGIYATGLQTELSVPLYWGLVPADMKDRVAANLNKRVEADNFHLDVGILGQKAILNALSENGYAGSAWKIASQETFPSWGWWIVNGATTLYENWNIDAQNDISLNHIMFGEIGAWLYKGLGGIYPDPAVPGFKHILMRPSFFPELKQLSVSHQTPYGKIVSEWEYDGKKVFYRIVIPPNATADLYLPEDFIMKRVKLINENKQIALQSDSDGIYSLLAGSYEVELVPGRK